MHRTDRPTRGAEKTELSCGGPAAFGSEMTFALLPSAREGRGTSSEEGEPRDNTLLCQRPTELGEGVGPRVCYGWAPS